MPSSQPTMPDAILRSIVRLTNSGVPAVVRAEDKEFAERAIDALNWALHDPGFLQQVKTAPYSSSIWLSPNNTLLTLTGDEIADIIVSGVEGGSPPNGIVDIRVEISNLRDGARGSTEIHNPLTTIDTDFFDDCVLRDAPRDLAALFMHEWMHSAGFEHRIPGGEDRDVPSMLQQIVADLSKPPILPNNRIRAFTDSAV